MRTTPGCHAFASTGIGAGGQRRPGRCSATTASSSRTRHWTRQPAIGGATRAIANGVDQRVDSRGTGAQRRNRSSRGSRASGRAAPPVRVPRGAGDGAYGLGGLPGLKGRSPTFAWPRRSRRGRGQLASSARSPRRRSPLVATAARTEARPLRRPRERISNVEPSGKLAPAREDSWGQSRPSSRSNESSIWHMATTGCRLPRSRPRLLHPSQPRQSQEPSLDPATDDRL